MNWNLICKIGFKVLTAAVAGVVVFVGINKATEGTSQQQNNPQQPQPQPQQNPNPQPQQQGNGEVIVGGLRATQDTCGKLLAFVQSLTMVAENLTRIFGKDQSPQQPYYGSPYYGQRPVMNSGGQTWTRISPFIIEAGCSGTSPMRGYGNYPF